MFSNTTNLCESGMAGLRNIKNTTWQWQDKPAMAAIAQHYTGSKLLAARSVYVALTEIASDQRTLTRCRAACSYIGTRAGVSEGTARRYLHELATLALISIEANGNRAYNTYHLLAVGEQGGDKLAAAAMMLADAQGVSTAIVPPTEGFSPAPLASTEGAGDDTLPPAKGFTSAPQSNKLNTKTKDNKQTMVVLDDGGVADGFNDALSAAATPPASEPTSVQIPHSYVNDDAIRKLASLGVRFGVASELVAQHGAAVVVAWVRYALAHTSSIRRPAGFVLSRLRDGEQPPMYPVGAAGYQNMGSYPIAQPEPPQRVLEALPAAEKPSQPIDGRVTALWQDVRRELIAKATTGGKLWLPHVRLVALEDDRAVLSSPPIGSQGQLEARYQAEIAGKLGDVLGCDIAVGWQAGW